MKTCLLAILLCCGTIPAALPATLNTAKIDQITGLKGKMNEKEGVYKVTFSSQRREGRRGRMDDAAFHGTWNVGCIHANKRWSNGDGRYGFV